MDNQTNLCRAKNKVTFSLLNIILFTTFFFARSVTVQEQWIVPTLLSESPFQDGVSLLRISKKIGLEAYLLLRANNSILGMRGRMSVVYIHNAVINDI